PDQAEAFFEGIVAPGWSGHQETVALLDETGDVRGIHVGMTAHHAVLLAGAQDRRHRLDNCRVLILPRVPDVLREVALADQNYADARDLPEHAGQLIDGANFLAHQYDQDLALWIDRPDVGALVVLLRADPPVARCHGRGIATLALRLVVGRVPGSRIAAGTDRVVSVLHGADVRPDHPVHARVEHLLGDPLVALAAIGRDAHQRGNGRRQGASVHELAAVQHVLQGIAQRADIVGAVLHLIDDAVVARGGQGERAIGINAGEAGHGRPAMLQRADHAIQTWQVGHRVHLPRVRSCARSACSNATANFAPRVLRGASLGG